MGRPTGAHSRGNRRSSKGGQPPGKDYMETKGSNENRESMEGTRQETSVAAHDQERSPGGSTWTRACRGGTDGKEPVPLVASLPKRRVKVTREELHNVHPVQPMTYCEAGDGGFCPKHETWTGNRH